MKSILKFKSKKLLLILILIFLSFLLNLLIKKPSQFTSQTQNKPPPWWPVQAIDTMKYSRDLSREKLKDETFNHIIEEQVRKIAQTGATHVAIATPYDSEFLPILWRWVQFARENNLNVWFRGNWAGWEGWFDYPRITREDHLRKTREFILQNKNLFEDGDIFTACPECENGGPGDPRRTGDIQGHRAFLIKEYQVTREAFDKIGKEVRSNFNSMNGDVAKLIMDKETTAAMDKVVVVDHYVSSVDTLVKDMREIASRSKGQVVLGEFGVPIIDIHGTMPEQAQAEWISEALDKLSEIPEVIGLNYWVNVGSTTQLWNKDGKPRRAVEVLSSFYMPQVVSGVVRDQVGRPIVNAKIYSSKREVVTNKQGEFHLPYRSQELRLVILAKGFSSQELTINDTSSAIKLTLVKEHEGLLFKICKFIYQLFSR